MIVLRFAPKIEEKSTQIFDTFHLILALIFNETEKHNSTRNEGQQKTKKIQ